MRHLWFTLAALVVASPLWAQSPTFGPRAPVQIFPAPTGIEVTSLPNLTGAIATPTSITVANAAPIRGTTTSGDTWLLQGYDNNTGPAYVTFATITNGNTPSLAFAKPAGGGTITYDGLTITTTTGTLTVASGKTLTASNTLTFTGTDASSVAFGAGGTVAYVGADNAFSVAQTFTLGTVFNNAQFGKWKDSGGTARPIIRLSDADATDLYIGKTGGVFDLVNFAQTLNLIEVSDAGAITITDPATAGAGADYICLSTGKVINQGVTCAASSREFKQDWHPIADALHTVLALNPVTFSWKPEYYAGKADVGFLADEVAAVDPRLAVFKDGQPWSIGEREILAVAVKAIQELHEEIRALQQAR